MPVMKCASGGYKWGPSGKCFPTKALAEQQGRAIMAMKKKKKGRGRGRGK